MESPAQAKVALQALRSLFQRHIACDLVLVVAKPEQTQFPVHKALLATFSNYFRKELENGKLASEQYEIPGV